jgi:hypothetical protein
MQLEGARIKLSTNQSTFRHNSCSWSELRLRNLHTKSFCRHEKDTFVKAVFSSDILMFEIKNMLFLLSTLFLQRE